MDPRLVGSWHLEGVSTLLNRNTPQGKCRRAGHAGFPAGMGRFHPFPHFPCGVFLFRSAGPGYQ